MYVIYSVISEMSLQRYARYFRMMYLYNIMCFPHNHVRTALYEYEFPCDKFFNYISSQGKREGGGVRLKRILV